jgi:hypothetical protein
VRQRALALSVAVVAVGGCFSTTPDYVAKTSPPSCDTRSKLVHRGFPEKLEVVLIGECTVTQMDQMRGPDLTHWLLPPGISSVFTSCDTFVPILFWTETTPEGKVTKVHFCPLACADLRARLFRELKLDKMCPQDDAGTADDEPPPPPNPSTFASWFDAGAWFGYPAAGSGGTGAAGSAGVSGSGGTAGAGGAAGASGL